MRLTTWHEPGVEVRARIEAPRDIDTDHARESVDATHIEVQVTSARVQVRTDLSDVRQWWKHGRRRAMPRVHYEIRVPRETDLDLDLDRVAATVRGVEGTIALQLNRTDLEATGSDRQSQHPQRPGGHRGGATARGVAALCRPWQRRDARCPDRR